MNRLIVLGGFMGTGKSTVGQIVAQHLDFLFIDTDTEIEARAGCTVAEIFTRSGESAFRQIEAEVCLDISKRDQAVVSVGGGALLNPHLYEAFAARSLMICLTCDLDEIMRRVGDSLSRPLYATNRDQLSALLASRADHYARFPVQIDTTHLSPEQAAQKVIERWHS